MAPNSQMTTAQARVVDPVLSTYAQGFTHPERVGTMLFPRAPVGARGARVIRFGKESFLRYNLRRAPGADTPDVSYGYASDPVALVQDALNGLVPIELMEEADAVPGIDLGRGAVDMVMEIITLQEEIEQAGLATDPNQYDVNHKVTLAGTDKWSSSANPNTQMRTYKESIRQSIGRYPNTLILGPTAKNAVAENANVKDQFKFTTSDSITDEMLARYFEVERLAVGKAVFANNEESDFQDVWGNFAVLAYVPGVAGNVANYGVPSYGYTYHLPGHPMVEQPWYDRGKRSWKYPTTFDRQVNLTSPNAGFLIQEPA